MVKGAKLRDLLLSKGFFPEVLPPCFDSSNLARSFKGMIRDLDDKKYQNRTSAYIRYSGTKHDGNRRYYGTVNPVIYFSVCQFIGKNWRIFNSKMEASGMTFGNHRVGEDTDDRAILVLSLSEVTHQLASKIKYAPFLVKTDIAQFFPSVYTHSLSWVAHGVELAKSDTNRKSKSVFFNQLDWHIQQCQRGQTRGVIVGPDAFRIIAEYIACDIDEQLISTVGAQIVGGVRHVDDFYIGVRSELDGSVVLSQLRDILQNYELQINDSKTQLLSGLHPIDDLWAQELRRIEVEDWKLNLGDEANFLLDKAFELSSRINSNSPIKLILRRLDKIHCYRNDTWLAIESKLQRILFHYPHCIDYLCLLIAKRVALGEEIDMVNWEKIIQLSIERSIAANHHHETLWVVWLSFVCKINISDELIDKLCKVNNSHIKAILIAGSQFGYCRKIRSIKLGSSLATDDENWLHNLVARSTGYCRTRFSGSFAHEFEKLIENKVKLLDFDKHMRFVAKMENEAISSSKYGYESEGDEDRDEDDYPFDFWRDEF